MDDHINLRWYLLLPFLIASLKIPRVSEIVLFQIFLQAVPYKLLELSSLTIRTGLFFFFQETIFFQQSMHIRFVQQVNSRFPSSGTSEILDLLIDDYHFVVLLYSFKSSM